MKHPTISILVPTYNCGQFLTKCLSSVFSQCWQDFEIIVVDNASTDATPTIVQSFADKRLKYVRNDANIGMVGNFNKALELANGELGVILCADDYWEPNFLSKSIAENPFKTDITFTNSFTLSNGLKKEYRNVHSKYKNISIFKLIYHMHGIPLSSLIFPITKIKTFFNQRLNFNCDLEYVIRLMLLEKRNLRYIAWPGVTVTLHDKNETYHYNIRAESIKLLECVESYTTSVPLRLLIGLKKMRFKIGNNLSLYSHLSRAKNN